MSYTKLNPTITLAGVLLSTTLIAGTVLASIAASADDSVVDDINVTIPISCTMTGTVNTAHSDEIMNGTYNNHIGNGSTTLKAFCNDNGGFAIYAAGYTGNEVGAETSNQLIGSTSGIGNIVTGTATSAGDPDVSNWAMKLTKTADSGDTTGDNAFTIDSAPNVDGGADVSFSDYHVVPNTYTKVAHKDTSTNMDSTAGGVTLTTSYAAYISRTQAAGTYSGKVIYTLVHPSTAPAPGSTFIMQDVGTWKDSLNVGDTTEAIDIRDNKIYQVAKLADGNIWMTQNLDHDIKTDGTVTYDSTTTDLPSGTTWTPASATYTTGTTTWQDSYTTPESYDPGELYWNGILSSSLNDRASCEAAGGSWEYDDVDVSYWCVNAVFTAAEGAPQYHIGNYYNWTTAIAMNDSSSITADGTKADQSICPAGWTLPAGGAITESPANKSFQNLMQQYGWTSDSRQLSESYKAYSAPLNFALSGHWKGGETPGSVGDFGFFWSSSVAQIPQNAYGLSVSSYGNVYPGHNHNRHDGLAVRCVSR